MSPQTPRPTKGLTERPEVRRVPKRSSLLPLGLRLLCAGVRQRDLAETASRGPSICVPASGVSVLHQASQATESHCTRPRRRGRRAEGAAPLLLSALGGGAREAGPPRSIASAHPVRPLMPKRFIVSHVLDFFAFKKCPKV